MGVSLTIRRLRFMMGFHVSYPSSLVSREFGKRQEVPLANGNPKMQQVLVAQLMLFPITLKCHRGEVLSVTTCYQEVTA